MIEPTPPQRAPLPPTLAEDRLAALWTAVDAEVSRGGLIAALRAWPTPTRVLLVASIQVAAVVGSLAIQGPRDDVAAVAAPLAAMAVAALGLSAVTLRSAAASPLRVAPWLAWAVLAPLVVVAPPVWPGVDMGFWEAMPAHVRCLAWSTGTAAVAVLPYVVFDRHGLLRRWSTYAAAGAAGALGFTVQMASCPLVSAEHRLLAHAGGGLLVAAVLAGLVLIVRRRGGDPGQVGP